MSRPTLDFRPILRELTDSALEVRQTLRAALRSVLPPEADFTSRQIADPLGLDKTLGWRCLRIATIADVAGILGSLPGDKAWRKVLESLARRGCPEAQLTSLAEAVETLTNRISLRGLSRETLKVIAAGELDDQGQQEALHRIWQQQFESARLIWGVSARADIGAVLVAPSAEGGMADIAAVTLLDELERHRDGPPWNIHVALGVHETATTERLQIETCPFLPQWSRPDVLGEELIGDVIRDRWRFDFVGRRPDRTDGIRVALSETLRRVGPLTAGQPDELVSHAMPHGLPAEIAIFDVFLHRSIQPSATPYAALYATIDRVASGAGRRSWPETTRLPLDSRTAELDRIDLPDSIADLSDTYREILAHATATLGGSLTDFRVHRTAIPHPPLPTTTVVRWGLPTEA